MLLDSKVSEVLDLKSVSGESVLEVRVASTHCIPGTTTSKAEIPRTVHLDGPLQCGLKELALCRNCG